MSLYHHPSNKRETPVLCNLKLQKKIYRSFPFASIYPLERKEKKSFTKYIDGNERERERDGKKIAKSQKRFHWMDNFYWALFLVSQMLLLRFKFSDRKKTPPFRIIAFPAGGQSVDPWTLPSPAFSKRSPTKTNNIITGFLPVCPAKLV